MDLGLKNKLAVITGSTSGIGQAIAKSLLDEGATVVINGRSQTSLDRATKELGGGDSLHGVAADVSTADGCAALVAAAEAIAPIDILINNAGIFEPKPFAEISDDDWQRFYEVNVMSGVRMSRAVMGSMQQRGWGRIVFISSESAINIPTEMVHYGMTKTAQLSISRGLAKTLKDTGVTVNCVLPGPTWSEGVEQFVESLAGDQDIEQVKRDFFRDSRGGSLIQRFASVEEVASLVSYVVSQRASATTGAALRCDGGLVDTCF
ncbi:SDR family NAD(P)-dependent oxidoreductase [Rosistilla oblonga]|uniref:SDR family NAD(P)-dependent oxidoreductase n=1 Tax=Rosistilla oblonga TaxID=2527990 RepID=UPI003A9779F8